MSVAGADGATQWISQVLAETDPGNVLRHECEELLTRLSASTWQQLVERQSAFELLLPDDDESASLRAEAMGQWCEGFLHGLVAEKQNEALRQRLAAEPLADIIRDMLQITRAEADDESDTEGDEDAWTELVEYLRVAAQLTLRGTRGFPEPGRGHNA